MGYYSEVVIAMSVDNYSELRKRFSNEFDIRFNSILSVSKRDHDVVLHNEYIKWHVEYDYVKFIVDYVSSLKGYEYRYIVIGDDVDDITYKGGYSLKNFDIDLIRKVKIMKR